VSEKLSGVYKFEKKVYYVYVYISIHLWTYMKHNSSAGARLREFMTI